MQKIPPRGGGREDGVDVGVTRDRRRVSVGTLANWRAMRIGPPYIKIGKAVLYPIEGHSIMGSERAW